MSVTGITAAALNAGLRNTESSSRKPGVGSNDFLKLLTTQLRFQNPLDPVNDSQFVSQLSQMSTVEGIDKLNASVNELLLMQGVSQGAALIGKKVSYDSDGRGTLAQGTVQSVQVSGGKVNLQVAGKSVSMAQVRNVAA